MPAPVDCGAGIRSGRSFLYRLKIFFPKAAPGADPVIRNILEGRTRLDAAVGIPHCRVIFITADTDILQSKHILLLNDTQSIAETRHNCKVFRQISGKIFAETVCRINQPEKHSIADQYIVFLCSRTSVRKFSPGYIIFWLTSGPSGGMLYVQGSAGGPYFRPAVRAIPGKKGTEKT